MVPPAFANFFIASTSAGAALVGLLFVAISIAPEHTVMVGAPIARQAVATNAFTSLVNAFFISLGALIPASTNLGWVTLVMSLTGVSGVLTLGWNLLRHRQRWQSFLRNMVLLVGSLTVYGYEFYYGVDLIKTPQDTGGVIALTELLIVVYAIGLIRAWELLGARRFGLLSWLSPLRTVNEEIVTSINERPELEANSLKRENQAAEAKHTKEANLGQQAQGQSR